MKKYSALPLKCVKGTGEMVQWLTIIAALAEDLNLLPRPCSSSSRNLMLSSGLQGQFAHMVDTHSDPHIEYIFKLKFPRSLNLFQDILAWENTFKNKELK